MVTYAASKTKNRFSSPAKVPLKPWLNSTTRYTDRMKMVIVARRRAQRNPLNLKLLRRDSYMGSRPAGPAFITRRANSAERTMNKESEKTWKAIQENMMWPPVVVSEDP